MSTALMEARLIKRITRDFPYFCENYVYIKNKDGERVLFKLRPSQVRLWKLIERMIAEGRPVRIIVLKARQLGFSTFMQAYLLWRTIFNPYSGCLTVAHDEKSSAELFGKIEFAYSNLPADLYRELEKCKSHAARGKKLAFGKPLDSSFFVDTAGNKNVGRSMTFQRVHLSEVAFWENIEKSMYGLLAALGKRPGTEAIIESTANGLGTYHYKLWQRACSGDSMWEPFFEGWNTDPDYAMPTPSDFQLSKEEKELKRRFQLTNEQLYWRRITIEDECGGDVELFRQEYPIEAEEAFIVSGNPYFGPRIVEKVMKQCKDPERWGRVELVSGVPTLIGGVDEGVDPGKTINDGTALERAPWWIWKLPTPGHPYAIGADVAGGTGKDFSSAHILDLETEEIVATFRGKLDPDEFAYQLRWMGLTYNVALIAPEKNGEGRATLLTLMKQVHYPRIFFHQNQEDWSGGVEQTFGWRTTSRTRPMMLAQLASALRDNTPKLWCERTAREMGSFIRVETVKLAEAAEGANDDMIISAAIVNSSEVRLHAATFIDLSEYQTETI